MGQELLGSGIVNYGNLFSKVILSISIHSLSRPLVHIALNNEHGLHPENYVAYCNDVT